MKKITVFGASTSSKSINRQLALWVSSEIRGCEVSTVDLNDFEMPIHSMDRELANGIPEEAVQFKDTFREADGIVISFAEHNGSYSAAFKNILDWVSRIKEKVWLEKPMLLLSTSPGGRGGAGVLQTATNGFPHMGGQVVGSFSLPSFNENFNKSDGIINDELKRKFEVELMSFKQALGA